MAKRSANTSVVIHAALALALTGSLPGALAAQSLGVGDDGDQSILIEADQGIEWRRNEQVYEAIGNAVATRGEFSVRADTLRAFYREQDSGKTDIFMLEAVGNVTITGTDMKAYGDRAVYDLDVGSIIISGRNVRLDTSEYQLLANGNLEYYERSNYAVATGGAKALTGGRELRADTLFAYFTSSGGPNSGTDDEQIERLVAEGNMVIITETEVVQAARGTYFPQAEIAMVEGDVQITRGDSHLVGELAEVNLATGVSRIMAGRPGESRRPRVIGLFTPGTFEPIDRPAQNLTPESEN
ncbi:MAG: hypothetical protein O7A03_01145 [Alphaproteobacteria bacterium]|nr:hypothetical protein [Alphaproteobacteria bacterium]